MLEKICSYVKLSYTDIAKSYFITMIVIHGCRPCYKQENENKDGDQKSVSQCECSCYNSALFTCLESEVSMMDQGPGALSTYAV